MLTKEREPRHRLWQVIGALLVLIGLLVAILT